MPTDEEYLDNLLKSMEENPVANRTDFPSIFQEEEKPEEKTVIKDLEAELSEPEPEPEDPELPEREPEPEESELPAIEPETEIETEFETEPETESVLPEEEAWKEGLDELLAGVEDDLNGKDTESDQLDDFDVTDLIDHLGETDDDLNEINDLLKKTDNNELIDVPADEDMTVLLNSMKEKPDALAEEEVALKKKKKSFSLPFGKKMKSKDKEGEEEENPDGIQKETVAKDRKEKKSGFWKRLMEELTREEEEPETKELVDENEEILKELEAEDQIREKKKSKKEKKKKDKKGKKNKDAVADWENEDAANEGGGKKKKKEKKQRREKKENLEEPKEKSRKILSKKMLFALIAFCATIIAAIVLLSIFLPDYVDKKNARTAFYVGDYNKVYDLLYDKKLNQSDQLIFERANAVLKLERRLNSYELNKKIGQKAEALDALLQGVLKYEELISGKTYGAETELQTLYQEILDHLNQDYGISEEEAKEINFYDSETYSRKIYSIVNGEAFPAQGMEDGRDDIEGDATNLKDFLPEEEDML